ncbi:MAG: DUF58 domain-containing protein [Spirochaetales bacterium]|nr:DUF58 domain-containing protein [Spirochaetales bacterium]
MEDLPLLSREFLEKLNNLTILSRRVHRRGQEGSHFSYRKGSSLEFREYRPYQAGDDVRFVDWNVWERLGKLLVKVFTAEEDRSLYLLMDTSGSMGSGEPAKLSFACETAAALAYIASRNQDRVGIFSLGEEVKSFRRPAKGSGALLDSFRFLEQLESSGTTNFTASCGSFLSGTDRSGLAVIFSDLLDAHDYREGIKRLLYRRFEVLLVHVLSEDDLKPGFAGPVTLKDREGGGKIKLNLDEPMLRAYKDNLAIFLKGAEDFCRSNGVEYLRASSSMPFEDFILGYLRRGGYLR